HLAFVVADSAEGATATFYGYVDGVGGALPDPGTGPFIGPRHSGGADEVSVGSAHGATNSEVNAVFDDFRVYDYNLTASEVQYLATDGAAGDLPDDTKMLLYYNFDEVAGAVAHNSSAYAFYHPLLSRAELYDSEEEGSRVINFRDFAVLADNWLKEQLWP
ncbi:MAG: LamG domain-containing protein, partial [Sedimentisphaerales bacterium]|nr:LamG domain-containing protein [Sedimentisphaerales bacterium]